jgi:predicted nucleic acid-binding protein
MTKNKAHNTGSYVFKANEHILIDANVWLYLQPPITQPPPYYAWRYSLAFKNLISAQAKPVIEVLVLSEYINRYLRLEYKTTWDKKYPDFKTFRCSSDFPVIAKNVIAEARQILKLSIVEDTPFSQIDLSAILDKTEIGLIDFNDGVLIKTCRTRGWKLLTNDADMCHGGIEVLTSNKKLLAACI